MNQPLSPIEVATAQSSISGKAVTDFIDANLSEAIQILETLGYAVSVAIVNGRKTVKAVRG